MSTEMIPRIVQEMDPKDGIGAHASCVKYSLRSQLRPNTTAGGVCGPTEATQLANTPAAFEVPARATASQLRHLRSQGKLPAHSHGTRAVQSASFEFLRLLRQARGQGHTQSRPLPPLAKPTVRARRPGSCLPGRRRPPHSQLDLSALPAERLFGGWRSVAIDGENWQVMRVSRDRNSGRPALVRLRSRICGRRPGAGWPGFLLGDMSQPRGGPMLNGHASHEVGFDADLSLAPTARARAGARAKNAKQ